MNRKHHNETRPETPFGLTDDFRQTALEIANPLRCLAGPNSWDEVTNEDYGFSFDYIVENHGTVTVIDPTSKAAREWLYRHLPEDCPRWGKYGFVVETNYVEAILAGMAVDGLLSEAEYVRAMNEEQELQNAQAHAADQENYS